MDSKCLMEIIVKFERAFSEMNNMTAFLNRSIGWDSRLSRRLSPKISPF